MRSKPTTVIWMGSAFCAALALTAIVLLVLGVSEKGTNAALALTARLSFLLFWAAYAGGALRALFGATFQPLKERSRDLGLSFASAHLVHLGLVGWLCWIGAVPSVSTFAVFGIAVVWTYLIALYSVAPRQQTMHPKLWWLLRVAGSNYIAFAFALDFLRHPLQGGIRHILAYWPFAILSVAGPMLRLTARILRTTDVLRGSPYSVR
jgi:hypothetical protein